MIRPNTCNAAVYVTAYIEFLHAASPVPAAAANMFDALLKKTPNSLIYALLFCYKVL
jgi:hypothetical protein